MTDQGTVYQDQDKNITVKIKITKNNTEITFIFKVIKLPWKEGKCVFLFLFYFLQLATYVNS